MVDLHAKFDSGLCHYLVTAVCMEMAVKIVFVEANNGEWRRIHYLDTKGSKVYDTLFGILVHSGRLAQNLSDDVHEHVNWIEPSCRILNMKEFLPNFLGAALVRSPCKHRSYVTLNERGILIYEMMQCSMPL
ncbi:hypothetical protein Y032_0169g231 [Ancylostoma ceylanicum]|uniref:Uncharacterized protein n=1 Tax=Ancylostoma ceylanicum TaxID=53326 RepID=A0A016SWE6_9BILA|nr:hypothetical protein Y032_0169g231 [Ancylostoma ceylanicum]